MAYAYMDSARTVRDSIASQRNTLVLAKTKQRMDAEKYASEVTKSDAQRSVNNTIRNSLMAFILLLSVIAILFINRQKLRHRQKQQQLEAEKRLAESARQLAENEKFIAESDLLNATVQLKDFTRTMRDKNELIEKFTEEIERYQSLPCSNELPNQNETLQQLQQSTILTEEQWDDFRNMFEKVHAGYLNRLRDKLPGLSPAEVRFITLSKLKFTNKEMAGVLGISTDAVRMNKHRLKKKLNLTEEDDLEVLVDAV
jgi:DNA-binding CsgD family transcriptional regulator